jgi:competence protein ComEC
MQRVKGVALMNGAQHVSNGKRPNLPLLSDGRSRVLMSVIQHANHWSSWELGPVIETVEGWFERRTDQLPILFPVGIGAGISTWQFLGDGPLISLVLATLGLGILSVAVGLHLRLARFLLFASLAFAAGYSAIAFKSAYLSEPAIAKIWSGQINARVKAIEEQSAREIVRLTLATDRMDGLPAKIRVNVPIDKYPAAVKPGAVISARVRLMPPPGPALPAGYDFSRQAWFQGLGATGSVLGDIVLLEKSDGNSAFWEGLRNRTARHIQDQMPEGTGAIGSALLVGSRGGISETDNEALRNSGMAHLLSVSGLHVTAVVGAVFILISRILALFPWFALRIRVPLVAAGCSALVAVGYTLLTGSEVPTVRACVAALMILVALMLGREALSMRLLAFGAIIILVFWPESLAGPSFQLSFAAVATIIFLHESPKIRGWTERRDEWILLRLGRIAFSLLLTGLAIEIVLAPIALFHFHKSGLYGAFANILAIPLTTFFIMPLQLVALCADIAGVGAPFWWLAGQGIDLIRWLAHFVSSAPGAVVLLPAFPSWAFACIIFGAIFYTIVRGRSGAIGLLGVAIGAGTMAMAQRPDILITGDGRHLAVVDPQGDLIMLRPAAGDYAMSMLTENAAFSGEPKAIETMDGALCSADVCTFPVTKNGRSWSVLATRSPYLIPAMEMAAACKRVDIVVSDRRLPYSCKPRWLKADRRFLDTHGGLALDLEKGTIRTVAETTAHHPWSQLSVITSENRVKRSAQ